MWIILFANAMLQTKTIILLFTNRKFYFLQCIPYSFVATKICLKLLIESLKPIIWHFTLQVILKDRLDISEHLTTNHKTSPELYRAMEIGLNHWSQFQKEFSESLHIYDWKYPLSLSNSLTQNLSSNWFALLCRGIDFMLQVKNSIRIKRENKVLLLVLWEI